MPDAAAADPRGHHRDEPPRESEERPKSTPPPPPAQTVTRRIDRERIELRGAARFEERFDPRIASAALRASIAVNNKEWPAEQRSALLAYLRGAAVGPDAQFTEADARVIAHLQAGSGARSDGVLRDETVALLLAMGFRAAVPERAPRHVQLEFYPGELEDVEAWNREIDEKVTVGGGGYDDVEAPAGEGTIYVRVSGVIVASYRGRGGPPAPLRHVDHIAATSTPGSYRLGEAHAHVSTSWYYSQIPWGAEIRAYEGGYQYRSAGRAGWSWATAHAGSALKMPIAPGEFEDLPEVTRDDGTFLVWNKNDFGPVAWNLVVSDMFVHTTPKTEEEAADATMVMPSLSISHGCVHIDPRERPELVERRYLHRDVPIVVRLWSEHLLPDEVRHERIAAARRASYGPAR